MTTALPMNINHRALTYAKQNNQYGLISLTPKQMRRYMKKKNVMRYKYFISV